MLEQPVFRTKVEYGERICDVAYWKPYVEDVCRRHSFSPRAAIRSGLPGTHPVFVVDEDRVVKFFSDLFSGGESFRVEAEVYSLLRGIPEFRAPRLLTRGSLFPPGDGWRWPYLVISALPGGPGGDRPLHRTLAQESPRHSAR
ncbi:MAG TPA: hypothetical protein VFJ58_04270 [Armatimonadota bacterium]|nr:hypothetical protein [Armatimonadota bacterium]